MKLLTRDTCCEKGTQQVPVCKDCEKENELYASEFKPCPGRPRLINKKVSLTIRINPELLARINGNRSAFIESAIVDRLNR